MKTKTIIFTVAVTILMNILSIFCLSENKLNLIGDFLLANNLKTCLVIYCGNGFDLYPLMKTLRDRQIWTSFYDISQGMTDPQKLFAYKSHQIGIIYDLKCPQTTNFLSISFQQQIFNASYNWLMFDDAKEDAENTLKPQNINWNAEITVAIGGTGNDTFVLYDVYNPSFVRGGRVNVTVKGEWSGAARNLKALATPNKIVNRSNFHGIRFFASSVLTNVPRQRSFKDFLDKHDNIHLDTLHRLHYHLVKNVMEQHNFTVFIYRTTSWGYLRNGKWDGGVGLLLQGKTDFGMSGLIPDLYRVGMIEFTPGGLSMLAPRFLFRHPKNQGIRNVFLSPFNSDLWIGLVVLLLLFGLGLCGTQVVKLIKIKQARFKVRKFLDLFVNSILVPIGIISQQGFDGNFHMTSSRIALIILLFFAFLMSQFYSTYIVSSLLMEVPRTITNITHLVDSSLKIIFENVLYNLRYLDTTSDPDSVRLYHRIQNYYDKLLYKPSDGIKLVKKGGYALHVDPAGVYKEMKDTFTESEICDMQEIFMFPKRLMYLTLQKGSPLKELLAVSLRRQLETGLTNYQTLHWKEHRPKCILSKEFKPVDIEHLSTALIGLTLAIGFSFGILILEIIFNWLCETKLRNYKQQLKQAFVKIMH